MSMVQWDSSTRPINLFYGGSSKPSSARSGNIKGLQFKREEQANKKSTSRPLLDIAQHPLSYFVLNFILFFCRGGGGERRRGVRRMLDRGKGESTPPLLFPLASVQLSRCYCYIFAILST